MSPPNPGAPILLFRSGAVIETIPRALVEQAIASLPPANTSPPSDGSRVARTLQEWLDMQPQTRVEKAAISDIATRLLEFAHNSPSELGALGLLSSRAGGRLRGDDAAPDDDVISAAPALALALSRFVMLCGHIASITIASPTAGISP